MSIKMWYEMCKLFKYILLFKVTSKTRLEKTQTYMFKYLN